MQHARKQAHVITHAFATIISLPSFIIRRQKKVTKKQCFFSDGENHTGIKISSFIFLFNTFNAAHPTCKSL